jgi:hypothetical protein
MKILKKIKNLSLRKALRKLVALVALIMLRKKTTEHFEDNQPTLQIEDLIALNCFQNYFFKNTIIVLINYFVKM